MKNAFISGGLLISLLFTIGYPQSNQQVIQELNARLDQLDEILNNDSLKDQTLSEAREILQTSYQLPDKPTVAKAHALISSWHEYYNAYLRDSILKHEFKALAIYQEMKDQKQEAASLLALSNVFLNENKFDTSRTYLFRALDIYEALEDQFGIANVYSNIASIYDITENYPEAKRYGELARAMLEGSDKYYEITINLMELIGIYTKLGEYDEAIKVGEECIRIYQEQNMKEVGIIARAYGFLGDAYKDTKDLDNALEHYVQAYEVVREGFGEEDAKSWKLDIGNILTLKGEYAKALPYLEESIGLYEEYNFPKLWVPYGYMSDCYRNLGQFDKALIYSEKARDEKDSMYMGKISNLESEMLIKYETGKKDEAIAQKDQQLAKEKQIRLLAFGLAALFAMLLFGLFYNYRKNQQITLQLKDLNSELGESNSQKELLLKEVHHRVKNNLQVISSLLSLQSRSIQDDTVKHAILDSQSRVRSMSLIHQKLYRGNNLAAIEMKTYFETLTDSLLDAYVDYDEDIAVELDMNNIELDVDYAIPLGLIANELLTNSLKYAFDGTSEAKINISLRKEDENMVLDIRDNGAGKSTKASPDREGGFGSELVSMLTEQLKGNLTVKDVGGYHTEIRFPYSLQAA